MQIYKLFKWFHQLNILSITPERLFFFNNEYYLLSLSFALLLYFDDKNNFCLPAI